MELESLKKQLKYLYDNNIEVTKLVTDRHTQVSAYMAHQNQKLSIRMMSGMWQKVQQYNCYVRLFIEFCGLIQLPAGDAYIGSN